MDRDERRFGSDDPVTEIGGAVGLVPKAPTAESKKFAQSKQENFLESTGNFGTRDDRASNDE